ncbi:MAG: signal peptidase I [Clostridia bacterium]|nr:signal peptidase I [Clostridia bacterium]
MNAKLKKAWNITTTVLVVLVVLCAVSLLSSRLLGCRVFTVLSGSMEPIYSPGDLIYVKEVDPRTVQKGDVITFVMNEQLAVATHQVIDIRDGEGGVRYFQTKGTANETPDMDPVHENNLIGVPQFSIPLLGYVSNFVQTPPGLYITIAVGVALIALVFLPDMIGRKKKEPTEEA